MWESVALWPSEIKTGACPNETADRHDTREAAESVCDMLSEQGFGGDGKVFPISVRVRPVKV